jgi:hypothetical protein
MKHIFAAVFGVVFSFNIQAMVPNKASQALVMLIDVKRGLHAASHENLG